MKRTLLLLAIFCMVFSASAQLIKQGSKAPWKKPVAEKYLAGAVPVVDGVVVFSRTVDLPAALAANHDEAFETTKRWIANGFAQSQQPISRKSNEVNAEKRFFSLQIEQWLTFTDKVLNLDRSRIYYTLDVFIDGNKAYLTIYGISYLYEEEREAMKMTAEEQITDAVALKKGGKTLYPEYGKFRVCTIQMVDNITASLQEAMK